MPVCELCAVAWDIDGTLVDSEPLHHESLLAGSLAFGVDLRTRPQAAFVGMHLGDIWAVLAPEFDAAVTEAEWRAKIRAHYLAHVLELQEIPGARQVMRDLAQMGLRQIAVSNSVRIVVDANLAVLGVSDVLEDTISFDDVTLGKPAPEPYLKGANLLGLRPAQVLAVEDSQTGARAALAAGCVVAGLGEAARLDGVIPLVGLAQVPQVVADYKVSL